MEWGLPEIILPLRLEVEYVELWDGAAADLDPVGALAAQPRLHLVHQERRGRPLHVGPLPAQRHPVRTNLLHHHAAICKLQSNHIIMWTLTFGSLSTGWPWWSVATFCWLFFRFLNVCNFWPIIFIRPGRIRGLEQPNYSQQILVADHHCHPV